MYQKRKNQDHLDNINDVIYSRFNQINSNDYRKIEPDGGTQSFENNPVLKTGEGASPS